jgi:hypothetical protein
MINTVYIRVWLVMGKAVINKKYWESMDSRNMNRHRSSIKWRDAETSMD